jgi:hypothetical protein
MLLSIASAFYCFLVLRSGMAEKRRYTVSLPDHVTAEIEKRSQALGATPTEYAGDIIRWWFGQGCPPTTADEAHFLKKKFADLFHRLEPLPKNLSVWLLDSAKDYSISDDAIVQDLLNQLGLPNLFAQAAEHDQIRLSVVFDNHPTHWLVIDFFKGSNQKDGNGLLFRAYPKQAVPRDKILGQMKDEARAMGARETVTFSQIPILEAKAHGHPKEAATK